MATIEPTQFGFRWGAAEVVRYFDHKGAVLIAIRTPRRELEVWVTPTGLLRITETPRVRAAPSEVRP